MTKLKITKYSVPVPEKYLPDELKKQTGLKLGRLMVLVDLHDAGGGQQTQALAARIRRLKPDVIVSAGDLLTAKGGKCRFENALALTRILAGDIPFFFVNGNHEERMKENPEQYGHQYEYFMAEMGRAGACCVNDSHAKAQAGLLPVEICGLCLPLSVYRRLHRRSLEMNDLNNRLGSPEEKMFTVLLAHHPDFFPVFANWGADLTLSGHLHGGMVRLPYFGGCVGATLKPFPFYDLGAYEIDGSRMIVSAGLGSHTIPVRVNDPPELVVADLTV